MSKLIETPTMGETVKRLVRSQMAAKGVEYKELVKRLEAYGVVQNESTLRTKINKGVMGTQLFLYIQMAMGVTQLSLELVREIYSDIEAEITCPKCQGSMILVMFEGIEIERCVKCEGMWFDMMEHDDLSQIAGSEVIDTGAPSKGKSYNEINDYDCPKCSAKMTSFVDGNHPDIWYESCSQCNGVFLDAGEFKDYKNYSISQVIKDKDKI